MIVYVRNTIEWMYCAYVLSKIISFEELFWLILLFLIRSNVIKAAA